VTTQLQRAIMVTRKSSRPLHVRLLRCGDEGERGRSSKLLGQRGSMGHSASGQARASGISSAFHFSAHQTPHSYPSTHSPALLVHACPPNNGRQTVVATFTTPVTCDRVIPMPATSRNRVLSACTTCQGRRVKVCSPRPAAQRLHILILCTSALRNQETRNVSSACEAKSTV
jgi:hypothetical protein